MQSGRYACEGCICACAKAELVMVRMVTVRWVIGSGESGTALLCRNRSKWPGLMLLGGHCPAANEGCLAMGRWPRSRNASVQAESRPGRRARWGDSRFLRTQAIVRIGIRSAMTYSMWVRMRVCVGSELTIHFGGRLHVELSVVTALFSKALRQLSGLTPRILSLPVLLVHAFV